MVVYLHHVSVPLSNRSCSNRITRTTINPRITPHIRQPFHDERRKHFSFTKNTRPHRYQNNHEICLFASDHFEDVVRLNPLDY